MAECPQCNGTGWRRADKGDLRAVEPCDCRRAGRGESWWLEQARIPRRFRDCNFEDFYVLDNNHSLQMAKVKAESFANQYPLVEKGLLFLGNPGVGKTHLTVAILKKLMTEKGVDCLFCTFPDLLEQLQESYDPVSKRSKAEILYPVLETEVVAIDDLGARRISDWVEDTVTYILNHRYNEKKPTLLTSNLPDASADSAARETGGPAGGPVGGPVGGKYRTADTLVDRIGIRVYSRLFEMCEKVSIQAEDYRQQVRQHAGRIV